MSSATPDAVKTYWHATAKDFDSLYDEKGAGARLFNKVFRRALRQRMDLTLQECSSIPNATVLDVGCGSGRMSTALALAGARKVTGVDFAPGMIELAHEMAKKHQVESTCEFRVADFMREDVEAHDAVVALGVLDYVADPVPFVRRMRALARRKVMFSAPAPTPIRSTLRRRRYAKSGVHVEFYTRRDLERIMREAGFERFRVQEIDAGYFVVGECA